MGSEISSLDSAQLVSAFPFTRQWFAHLSETSSMFSSFDRLLFVVQIPLWQFQYREVVNWESVLSSRVSISVWIPFDVFLMEWDWFIVKQVEFGVLLCTSNLLDEVLGRCCDDWKLFKAGFGSSQKALMTPTRALKRALRSQLYMTHFLSSRSLLF